MLGDLVDDLGPPLKALSTLCGHSLKSLRDSFAQSGTHRETTRKRQIRCIQPQDFMDLAEDLERALLRFESMSNYAVLRLYRKSDLISASVTAQGVAFMSASSSLWKSDGEKEKEKEGNISPDVVKPYHENLWGNSPHPPRCRLPPHPPVLPQGPPHAPNTMQTPSRTNLSFFGKVAQMLWSIGNRLQQRDVKYAIKAGMATTLLATPVFFG
ncbi:hypothetical protein PLEOSDRAFT_156585 [Pleurotus ostreatus PC15]|uniref:Uncharacterized protein n=1 Tax=Pleurotus ostreatus (strain PC15) TaxID=1137138 RepID=A0A067NLS1_PLEO1|nr:hypothetical protein PLEOSDRAFT_156585 [Pleurotus ostreatus PC15]